jgi:hypothetical protein
MQRLNISLVGNLSVTIAGSRSNTLGISVSNQQCAGYSYCPQTETITIAESPHGLPKLSLQYPGHFQLHQLTVCGSRVIVEGISTSKLSIHIKDIGSHVVLRGNSLEHLVLRSDSRNIVDLTQQALPRKFSHQLSKDTTVRMPNQGPPTCIVCFENEITQVFVACGHWCLCSACSSMDCCPVCRKESQQLRIYQQSATHYS